MRNLTSYILTLLISIVIFSEKVTAQESSTIGISRATEFSVGSTDRLDTYLSPQSYRGTDVRFISNVLRSRKNAWDLQFTHEGSIDFTHNKSKNADALSGHYDFAFAMMHRWDMMNGDLTLRAGGMADLYLGFAYHTHNTANNPAQGYASIAIGGAGMATYNLHLGRHTYPITYEARLPLVGVMFSPSYGQSYYEMFNCGDYDNNIVVTSMATPCFRHQLSIDFPLGKRTLLRIGYLGDIRQSKPNSLRQHIYTHSFVIGWVTNILPLNSQSK